MGAAGMGSGSPWLSWISLGMDPALSSLPWLLLVVSLLGGSGVLPRGGTGCGRVGKGGIAQIQDKYSQQMSARLHGDNLLMHRSCESVSSASI